MSYQQELTVLNHVTTTEAFEEFLRCCGSRRWAEAMVSQRPFSSLDSLVETANTLWCTSNVSDWFEAFAAHPKIGDAKALKEKFSKANSWEGGEQSGANTASEETLLALQQLNDEYHAKNGFIFLICATGKSADEMLAALRLRLANDRETEVRRCDFLCAYVQPVS